MLILIRNGVRRFLKTLLQALDEIRLREAARRARVIKSEGGQPIRPN